MTARLRKLVGNRLAVQELLDLANPAMPEGDWTVVNGSQNYPIESGITVDVILSKVEEPAPETVTMNIQFKDGDEVVAGGDYFVPAGVQNYAVLEQYVPEGYKMTISGDFTLKRAASSLSTLRRSSRLSL